MKKLSLLIALALSLNSFIQLDAMGPAPAADTSASAQAAQPSSAKQTSVKEQGEGTVSPQKESPKNAALGLQLAKVKTQGDFNVSSDFISGFFHNNPKFRAEHLDAIIDAIKKFITTEGNRSKFDATHLEKVFKELFARDCVVLNNSDFSSTAALSREPRISSTNDQILGCLMKISEQAKKVDKSDEKAKAELFEPLFGLIKKIIDQHYIVIDPKPFDRADRRALRTALMFLGSNELNNDESGDESDDESDDRNRKMFKLLIEKLQKELPAETSPRGQGRSQAEIKGAHEEAIVIDTRSFYAPTQDGKPVIRTDVREMLDALRLVAQNPSVSFASSASNPNEVINQQLDQARDRLQPIVQAVHKHYPQPSEPKHWTSTWKGHVLTATVASAVTLGAVYGALKVSGFK